MACLYNIVLVVFMCTLFPSLARSLSPPPLSGIVSAMGWKRLSTSFKASGSAHHMFSNNNNRHLPSLFIYSRATTKQYTTTRNVNQNQCCNNDILYTQGTNVSSGTSTHTKLTRLNTSSSLQMTSSSPSDNAYTSSNTPPNENNNKKEESFNISIEYCSACRWMLRSNWIASEVLTTFANESRLHSVTLIPCSPPLFEGGIFRIYATKYDKDGGIIGDSDYDDDKNSVIVLWDRKEQGRFPESKEVKQLVRDCVNPNKDLGHSDKDTKQISSSKDDVDKVDVSTNVKEVDCVECKEKEQQQMTFIEKKQSDGQQPSPLSQKIPSNFYEHNQISIEYSVGSSIESPDNKLYQATYYANELLSMIYERNAYWKMMQQEREEENGKKEDGGDEEALPVAVDLVTLVPNRIDGGILRLTLNNDRIIYEQSTADDDDHDATPIMMDGTHLRDIVSKAISSGKYDDSDNGSNGNELVVDVMDEDEAEEARKYFGVF